MAIQLTAELKERVVAALTQDLQKSGKSQGEYAKMLRYRLNIPFSNSAFSLIKKPEQRSAIKDTTWITLAIHFNVANRSPWKTAKTVTYSTIQEALDLCRESGLWMVLCDRAGIGKSYAAKDYAEKHRDSVLYIDCSICHTVREFINELAMMLGVNYTYNTATLWRNIVAKLMLMDSPLIIFDEFGDVKESIITRVKSLYNEVNDGERVNLACYFIGADNLRKRLINGRKLNKPSYAEFWSRIDNHLTDLDFAGRPEDFMAELRAEIEAVVDANLPEVLRGKRELIIEKCLGTQGVRAVRKQIALQGKLLKLNNLNTV